MKKWHWIIIGIVVVYVAIGIFFASAIDVSVPGGFPLRLNVVFGWPLLFVMPIH